MSDPAPNPPPWSPQGDPGGPAVPPPPPPVWAGAPAAPRRARGWWPLLVAVAVVIALAVFVGVQLFGSSGSGQSGSSGSVPPLGTASEGTFQGSGITFHYPPSWPAFSRLRVQEQEGSPTGEIGLGPSPEGVIVQTFHLRRPVAPADAVFLRAEISQVVTSLARQGGGTIESPLTTGHLGDMPAFTVRIGVPGAAGVPFHDLLVFAFRDSTEYFVNCQSTTADEPQIIAGCNEVLQSFHVS